MKTDFFIVLESVRPIAGNVQNDKHSTEILA